MVRESKTQLEEDLWRQVSEKLEENKKFFGKEGKGVRRGEGGAYKYTKIKDEGGEVLNEEGQVC